MPSQSTLGKSVNTLGLGVQLAVGDHLVSQQDRLRIWFVLHDTGCADQLRSSFVPAFVPTKKPRSIDNAIENGSAPGTVARSPRSMIYRVLNCRYFREQSIAPHPKHTSDSHLRQIHTFRPPGRILREASLSLNVRSCLRQEIPSHPRRIGDGETRSSRECPVSSSVPGHLAPAASIGFPPILWKK